MVSSTFNNRIEPGFNAAPKPDGTWWYRNAGTGIGPVTEEHVQALVDQKVIDRSTMVWCDEFGKDWKRLDETSLWKESSAPPAFEEPISLRWQKAFKAAADMEGAWSAVNRTGTRRSMGQRLKAQWTLFSIPGFFFGPLYYFYLRMWQKGLLVLTLVLLTMILEDVFGLTKNFASPMWMLFAINAKRDYYKFRIKGEVMWPGLSVFKNTFVDVGVFAAVAALFIGVGYVELSESGTSEVAPTKAVAETTAGSPAAKVSRVATKTRVSVSEPEELQSGTISVEATPDFKGSSDGSTYNIVVTSKVDGIIVSGIEVNRGNCNAQLFNPGLKHFGEIANGWAACKPIELKVLTNSGIGKFSFDD